MIRDSLSDGKKFQQWAFPELQQQTKHKAELAGLVVETVEPSPTSQQCSKCTTTRAENRAGQHFECPDCSYTSNADCNAVKNVVRKLALQLQRRQNFPL